MRKYSAMIEDLYATRFGKRITQIFPELIAFIWNHIIFGGHRLKERRNKQYDIITLWICVYVLHTAIYASFCNHLCHLSISCLIICDGVSTHTLRLGALGDLRLLYCVYSVVYRLFVNAFMHSYLPKNKKKSYANREKPLDT